MILLAIVVALLLEQVRPPTARYPVARQLERWAGAVARNVDTGRAQHAGLAWALVVLLPALGVAAVHALLDWLLGWPLALLWSIGVLYLTLGFRQFSHHFTAIREALELGDEERARTLLARWQGADVGRASRSEIVRQVLEQSVLASHRHVFGVLAWFCVLAMAGLGPAGAVLYRQAERVSWQWRHQPQLPERSASAMLAYVAGLCWYWIDWLPARLTALGLAIVGSFEDAIEAWRQFARRFPNPNDGVILAAAAGALGVRLGGAELRPATAPLGGVPAAGGVELGTAGLPGEAPDTVHFARMVGLMWRMVALWLLLLVLLTLAHVLG